MRRPFFHDRPLTLGMRFLALWPTFVEWQIPEKIARADASPIGGPAPTPVPPRYVWLQHTFQVLEENWSEKHGMHWRCVGHAVPPDFVRRSPVANFRRLWHRRLRT